MNASTLPGLANALVRASLKGLVEDLFDDEVQKLAMEYAYIAVAHFEMRMARERVAPKVLMALTGLFELLGRHGNLPEGATPAEILPELAVEQTWPVEDVHPQIHADANALILAKESRDIAGVSKRLAAKLIHLWTLNENRTQAADTYRTAG